MSAALVRSQPLEPELRLAQAISAFEADLPEDEKTRFKAQRQQRPEPVDVMRLTAEIDRTISSKGIKRGFGPRWSIFLEGIQHFASIGDILVGGSQYLPACAVWTLVRFSLMSIVQYSSYVDKLSQFFMEIGRTTPRYQNMSLLFPNSRTLQTNFTEYYIVVVRLCHDIFKMLNKHKFKLFLSLYDDNLNSFKKELKIWADAVRDEVNIQSVILAKAEQSENSQFRSIARKDRNALEARRKEKQRLHLLDACSVYDHQTTWKQLRKSGNTLIHEKDFKYQDWKFASVSSTLVYSGKLGAGKSVLLANIVDDLFLDSQSELPHIVYFFCRHDILESLRARTVIGSLTRQLLLAYGITQSPGVLSMPPNGSFDIDQLSQIIIDTVSRSSKLIYLVIDGLNECEPHERNMILKIIGQWQTKTKTRILLCISSRWEPDGQTNLHPTQLICPTYSNIPDQHPELGAYVDSEIEARVNSGKLKLGDPDIVSTIKEVLYLRSQGMFLCASLLINWICDLTSDRDILEALPNIPSSLFDIYRRLLNRHNAAHKQYQEAILKLVSVSYRPLSTSELREALSVVPGETEWDNARLSNDITGLLLCCNGLVIIDEEELSVRFVHESARQFLLLEGDKSHQFSFTVRAAEQKMTQVITTYLNFSVFDTQISTTVLSKLPGDRVVENALSAVSKSSSRLLKTFSRLTGPPRTEVPDISRILAETAMKTRERKISDLSLEKYARKYWFLHSACILDDDPMVQILVKRLIQKQLRITTADMPTPLSWAISNGYLAAFELLTNIAIPPERPEETMQEAVKIAAVNGHHKMVEKYLQEPDLFYIVDKGGLCYDLILLAAAKGWKDILKSLLDQDSLLESIWITISKSDQHVTSDRLVPSGEDKLECNLLLQVMSKEWSTVLEFWNNLRDVSNVSTNRHENLAKGCLDLMLSAECLSGSDICCLKKPGILRTEIKKVQISRCIPSEIRYACLYWIWHLRESNCDLSSFEHLVTRMLKQRLLFWLEAVSLLGKASEMIVMVSELSKVFAKTRNTDLKIILYHTERFILASQYVADLSPLQLHVFSTIFVPKDFNRKLETTVPPWLEKVPGVLDKWPVLEEKVEIFPYQTRVLIFSPDGKQLASASYDGTLKLWDVATVSLQYTLKGHSDQVTSVTFSPDGKQLASASDDNTVKIWDTTTGSLQHTLKRPSNWVRSVIFSPDGKQLASISYDNTVKISDTTTGSLQRTLRLSDWITSVAFSPNGKQLASASLDSTIKLWDIATGSLQRTIRLSDWVRSVAFSSDGKQMASASDDNTVKIWDITSGKEKRSIKTENRVEHLTFHPSLPILETDQGDFQLDTAVPASHLHVKRARLSLVNGWINVDGQRLIWLPEDYRKFFAEHRQYAALGLKSGGVAFLEISFDEVNR